MASPCGEAIEVSTGAETRLLRVDVTGQGDSATAGNDLVPIGRAADKGLALPPRRFEVEENGPALRQRPARERAIAGYLLVPAFREDSLHDSITPAARIDDCDFTALSVQHVAGAGIDDDRLPESRRRHRHGARSGHGHKYVPHVYPTLLSQTKDTPVTLPARFHSAMWAQIFKNH